MARLDEFALIRLLNDNRQTEAFLRLSGVVMGIGDDAAVVQPANGCQLVFSCDTMVEDVHFKTVTMRDEDIGYKALATNLSDIAAMGGNPRWALVSLSVPREIPLERLQAIYRGLYECAETYQVAVVGGDTTRTYGGLTITVAIAGEVPSGQALYRSAARNGDIVFMTGMTGLSAAGLHYLLTQGDVERCWREASSITASLIRAHCRPEPHCKAGRLLRLSGVCGALNDVSDGLGSEAWEIAEASGIGLLLYQDRIPVHDGLREYAGQIQADPWQWILYGGEDYVLLGTVRENKEQFLREMLEQQGIAYYPIGQATDRFLGVRMIGIDGNVTHIEKNGYGHFREAEHDA